MHDSGHFSDAGPYQCQYQRVETPFMGYNGEITLLPNTPLVEEEQNHQSSSAVRNSGDVIEPANYDAGGENKEPPVQEEDDGNEEDGNEEEKGDETRKVARVVPIVPAIAPPQEVKTRGRPKRKTVDSSVNLGLLPAVQCKGGCGHPPVLPLMCVHCQQLMCLACSLKSGPCSKPPTSSAAINHVYIPVEYISEMLRAVIPDSKQLDTWIMMCAQDIEAWLLREKKIKTWFNPKWNGTAEQRAKLLQRIAMIAGLPEAELRPAVLLKPDGSYCITRTHSEPAFFEESQFTLIVAVTFPSLGCFSLAKPTQSLV